MQHGLTLGDKELRALKQSRPQGIQAINTMLGHVPGLHLTKDQRLNFAMRGSGCVAGESREAKLSREYPTALNEAGRDRASPADDFRAHAGKRRQERPASVSCCSRCLWV